MSPTPPQTYIIYSQVTNIPVTEEAFLKRLKIFSSTSLLRVCSALNMILTQWADGYDDEGHARLVRSFFPPSLATLLLVMKRPVFHRHQLLFVAQQALLHCEVKHETPATLPNIKEAGTMMLMASELIARPTSRQLASSQELARRICSVLPDMETNGPTTYSWKMARSIAMCTRFADQFRGAKHYFDIRSLFREATGIDLDAFYALLFGCFSRFLKLDEIKKSMNLLDYCITGDFFRKCTAIDTEELNRFFAYVSNDASGFASEVQTKHPHYNDLTILRNKPLFADNEQYFPLDLSLLADKMESGVFWSVHNSLPDNKRGSLHQFWGDVFEQYICWLVESSVDGRVNRFIRSPRYAKRLNEEVCDIIVISDRSAVLIECKGSTFSAEGKYGGDPQKLDAELKKKFVHSETSRKGVRQLGDSIQNLFGKNSQDEVYDLNLSNIDTVIPILLTRDDIGAAFNVSAYLNLHFQEAIREMEFTRAVSPLCAVSACDVERLAPYLRQLSLAEIFLGRIKGDKDLIFPLWSDGNSLLTNLDRLPSQLLIDEIERLGQICISRLGLQE